MDTAGMVPAKGGASPAATLLAFMPTGFFSMKLWYMVHAVCQKEAKSHNKPNAPLRVTYLTVKAPPVNRGDVTVQLLPPSGSTP